MGDSEESMAPSVGIRVGGKKRNCLYMKGNVIPKSFSSRTALLLCLPVVSYFMRSYSFPRTVKARDKHMDGVGPDPFSLTLAVHVSFLILEGIIWTVWTDLGYML